MKRIFLIIALLVIVIFIGAQFFQPEKNLGEINSSHILKQENVPEQVKTILTNSCLDCHSNTTNYLWFHNIAPVAWMVNDHIVEGKDELNFSEWGEMDAYSKMDALDEMCEEVEKGKMPIKSYTIIHAKAKMSDADKKLLCDWAEKRTKELMAASVGSE